MHVAVTGMRTLFRRLVCDRRANFAIMTALSLSPSC
jgi:hypothetical protein